MYGRASVRALICAACVIVAAGTAFGQRQGGSRSSAPSTSSGKFSFKGTVKMEDGSVPTARVTIETVCVGMPWAETTMDKKGGFSFWMENPRMGQTSTEGMKTASGVTARPDCIIRASLPGYVSDVYEMAPRNRLTDREDAENPEVGELVLHKQQGEGGDTSATSEKAPKDAKKAFDKGASAMNEKKYAEASKNLQKAVEIYPQYAVAWALLGECQIAEKQPDAARKSFEASIQADGKYLSPYLQIANLEADARNWKGLADVTSKVIALAPGRNAQVYLANTMANINLRDLAAAEKSAAEGVKADVKHERPRLHQYFGSLLANKGDFANAIQQWELYLQYSPNAQDAASTREMISRAKINLGAQAPQKK